MINPDLIRQDPDRIKKNTSERYGEGKSHVVDEWLEIDKTRKVTLQNIEQYNAKRNEISAAGKTDPEKAKQLAQELRSGLDIKAEEDKLAEQTKQWTELINQIPNLHLADVPVGKSEDENVTLKEVGEKPNFDFEAKTHLELGEALGILDFESGAKVSGSQFYFLKNDAVRLEFALAQFGMDVFTKKGYTLVSTPDLAKSRYYLGTGYAPRGDEAQIYEINGEDLGLIATAEVTMAGMYADQIVDAKDLPLKFAAISHCFRKEAGAYGKYSKGLYRVHQFTKLEMFVYCKPEDSDKLHQELLEIEEEIARALKIPYRVIQQCTGDLGASAAKKYDLEAWMPGRNDYGEITSTSNCTDYQARNLNIKFRDENGKVEFLHMLNGTAIVMSRFPIAIMENYQQADGTIKVPEVLQKYMGKEVISK